MTHPRIYTEVFKNDPKQDKHCQADGIPPEKFPLYLTMTLSQKEADAVGKIKTAVGKYPKDEMRVRTSKNLYCNSIAFRCYFPSKEGLEGFCDSLFKDGITFIRSPILHGDMPLNSVQLGAAAQATYGNPMPLTPRLRR